jgi:hypothetical protein
MRGLNLSRLGRASEGKFFADRLAEQAIKSRSKLSKGELASSRCRAGGESSRAASAANVDVVASIAGHSVYERLALANARAAFEAEKARPEPSALLRRLAHPDPTNLAMSKLQMGADAGGMASVNPDAGVMRAMGRNRMALYRELQAEAPARPLPGAEIRAEGAVVGAQAFVIATSLVGSIGIAGILYLYFTPHAVDDLRLKSIRFRKWVESGPIGQRMRATAQFYRDKGSILSPETQDRARAFAKRAIKADTVANVAAARDDSRSSSQSTT